MRFQMKNRILILTMSVIAAVGMISCGNPAEPEEFILTTQNVNNCIVSIGNYKDITVDVDKIVLTDELIGTYTDEFFAKQAESLENWVAGNGDTVVIDYTGTVGDSGKKNVAGTDQAVSIGKNTHLDGFEDELIGSVAGAHLSFTVSYPENYYDESLAGKKCDFDVHVKKVIPGLSDESVAALKSEIYSDKNEFKLFVYNNLSEFTEKQYKNDVFRSALNKIVTTSEFSEIPKGLVEGMKKEVEEIYADTAAKYGVSVSDYLRLCDSGLGEEALKLAKEQIVIYKIALDEGLEIDDAELDAKAAEYVELYEEYASLDDYFAANPREELREKEITAKVSDYILSVANR